MIAGCNLNVWEIVAAIQLLYTACITDELLPAPLYFKDINESDLQECNLILALALLESS
jgi:hypothetical protein